MLRMKLAGVGVNLDFRPLLSIVLFSCILPLIEGINYALLLSLIVIAVFCFLRRISSRLEVLFILLIARFYQFPCIQRSFARKGCSSLVLLQSIDIVFLHLT